MLLTYLKIVWKAVFHVASFSPASFFICTRLFLRESVREYALMVVRGALFLTFSTSACFARSAASSSGVFPVWIPIFFRLCSLSSAANVERLNVQCSWLRLGIWMLLLRNFKITSRNMNYCNTWGLQVQIFKGHTPEAGLVTRLYN